MSLSALQMNNMSMIGQGLRVRSASDERDHKPKKSLLEAAGRDYNYWIPGPILDQGPTSQCVEYSTRAFLSCNPVKNDHTRHPFGQPYAWMQRNDEWPGEAYEGTSVHAAMKWLKANGYIESYEWAQTVEQLYAHLMARGPAVIGSDWTLDMFTPDRWGYIRPTGRSVGGHAYLLRGGNRRRVDPFTGRLGAFRKRGSWGGGWGERGEAWISFDDMQRLMDDPWVEVALPVEKRVP